MISDFFSGNACDFPASGAPSASGVGGCPSPTTDKEIDMNNSLPALLSPLLALASTAGHRRQAVRPAPAPRTPANRIVGLWDTVGHGPALRRHRRSQPIRQTLMFHAGGGFVDNAPFPPQGAPAPAAGRPAQHRAGHLVLRPADRPVHPGPALRLVRRQRLQRLPGGASHDAAAATSGQHGLRARCARPATRRTAASCSNCADRRSARGCKPIDVGYASAPRDAAIVSFPRRQRP